MTPSDGARTGGEGVADAVAGLLTRLGVDPRCREIVGDAQQLFDSRGHRVRVQSYRHRRVIAEGDPGQVALARWDADTIAGELAERWQIPELTVTVRVATRR